MLKLPKGLKKKKKGKKSKKDQELFNEEELEKYRRDHQNQQQSDEHIQSGSATGENDDEWSKFKALTAGVDTVLKQKQEDLNRIKSTSFFQRVPPPSEVLKQEEDAKEEREKLEEETAVATKLKQVETEVKSEEQRKLSEAVVDLSDSESEEDDCDDIFDTAYIDVINAAEVGLVNVESPVAEDEGPDPFDTSYADKVIKGPELSKRGKKLVSIGSAVEVLTGRVETVQSTVTSRRPRRGPKDLLLEAIDDTTGLDILTVPEPVKTLLDDPADELSNVPIDLSVSLHIHLQQQKDEKSKHYDENNRTEDKSIVDNFDLNLNFNDNEDEFAQLAVESLTHKDAVAIVRREDLTKVVGETDWSFFEQKAKQPPPRPAFGPKIPAAVSDEDLSFQEDSSDPFDTAFVEKILPATLAEDLDFDPRAEELIEPSSKEIQQQLFAPDIETKTLNLLGKIEPTDLLRGSNSDLSELSHSPIVPTFINQTSQQIEVSNCVFDDPFDTSGVETAVAPGQIELKFLEREFLSGSEKKLELKHSISDPDFDPRADDTAVEIKVERIELASDNRKSSLVLNINNSNSRLVKFSVPSPDFLKTDDNLKLSQKPLTPYYTEKSISLLSGAETEDKDPFDTTFVSDIKPSDVELNLIEKQILTSNLKHSLSDPNFDPRASDAQATSIEETQQKPTLINTDLLTSGTNDFTSKVLTPAVENRIFNLEPDCILDPFDTSTVDKNLQPGKGELKILVNEFVPEKIETDLFEVESQESIFAGKVLTPQPTRFDCSEEEVEVDPFDTTFAENIQPGSTEIKFIETELINSNQ